MFKLGVVPYMIEMSKENSYNEENLTHQRRVHLAYQYTGSFAGKTNT